jgi:hypothetical protein
MYGDNYGYRSDLNASMVAHLHGKIRAITTRVKFSPDELVIDIGSNDRTSLAAYPDHLVRDRAGAPGAKTRTVQTMALGRAVLGSTIAFEGIPIVNRRHVQSIALTRSAASCCCFYWAILK